MFEWITLLVRWAHIITAIAWIGASFYFVWLDMSLEEVSSNKKGLGLRGELWAIHGLSIQLQRSPALFHQSGGRDCSNKVATATTELEAHLANGTSHIQQCLHHFSFWSVGGLVVA